MNTKVVMIKVCFMFAATAFAQKSPVQYTTHDSFNDWFVPAGEFVRTQPRNDLDLQIEVNRLLVPDGASFGMTCIPSLMQEWAISVDEATKKLIVVRPGSEGRPEVLWGYVRDAMYEMVNKGNYTEMRKRKTIKDYRAPELFKRSVTLSDKAVGRLRRLFDKVVSTARHEESDFEYRPSDSWAEFSLPISACLDGTSWTVFDNSQCVNRSCSSGDGKVGMFVHLVNQLRDAVIAENVSRVDSLMLVADFVYDAFNLNSITIKKESACIPLSNLLDKSERNNYLISKALEANDIFTDGRYNKGLTAEVSDVRVFDLNSYSDASKKHDGGKYYTVTLTFEPSYVDADWPFESKVDIWADTGEPFGIIFGNHWGCHFFSRPYSEWVKYGSTQRNAFPATFR